MMSLNKKSHIAALCVPRVALAFLIFGAGGAFSDTVVIQGQTPWIVDFATGQSHFGSVLSDISSDLSWLQVIDNRLTSGNGSTLHNGLLYDVQAIKEMLEGEQSNYPYLGVLDYLDRSQQNFEKLMVYMSRMAAITNFYDSMGVFFESNQYAIVSGIDGVNSALRTDSGNGEETIAEIVADIRDRMTNQNDFALGTAFTNLASALSLYYKPASSTNFENFADSLLSDDGSFKSKYSLMPLYYSILFGDAPFDLVSTQDSRYPSSINNISRRKYREWLNAMRDHVYYDDLTNTLISTSHFRYDAYNTYETYLALSNLFYNANMLTWTNQQTSGVNSDNFALQWFDSYNTKFQNMLLEYGTLAAITNENKQQVEFARNWYDSYSPRVILEYLLNSDFLNGTNSLSDTLEALDDKVDSYSLSKLPTFGMNTNSASIDMGVINATPDSGYKSVGDNIQDEDYNQASYLNDGWRIFDTVQDKYENAIDIIIGQIFEFDGGDSKAFRDGGEGGDNTDSVGLSLRVNPVRFRNPFTQQETTIIPEDYIDFTLPAKAKDKLEDYWSLIKTALEWGMWIWAFLYCWNLLAGSDTKQSSPTILD